MVMEDPKYLDFDDWADEDGDDNNDDDDDGDDYN